MKWLKWLFRKKLSPDLLQYSMYNFPQVGAFYRDQALDANVQSSPQQYLEARNISPDEHVKYMAIIAHQLASVGVIEEGCPVDWHTDDGNGRVDA